MKKLTAAERKQLQDKQNARWTKIRSTGPAEKLPGDQLPPHDEEAERAALGCILLDADRSPNEQEALLGQLRPSLFYLESHKVILSAMADIKGGNHALDAITLYSYLKNKGTVDQAGGLEYIQKLPDATPSVWNFPTYLDTLREKALRRWTLSKQKRLGDLAAATELSPDQLRQEFSEIYEQSERIGGSTRPRLKIWKANEIRKHEVPAHLALVGDNEICMGYDGIVVMAGPGSSGKSLCVASLALAGAKGKGTWMGRKIHRQFKTLIIQAENGITRLKKEVEALVSNNPGVDVHGHIFFSEPPEGGLPFHNGEFRTAVRRAIAELKPDLVVVDPWSQVATEDAAKEVVDKLGEIRSCFPAGDQCPGLLIVAHTKKP
ncbi:MAG TPA: DnaB-like helicase N-terminal domain-containing protein, partial [Verrucomicrobiae bacterium]